MTDADDIAKVSKIRLTARVRRGLIKIAALAESDLDAMTDQDRKDDRKGYDEARLALLWIAQTTTKRSEQT